MSADTLDEQLDKYLADVHAIEEQALAQMRRAPDIAGDERLAQAFAGHLPETRAQEDRVRRRLEDRGADTAAIKDLAGRLGGVGMIAFAKANPDTPGKLTAHAYSYEHMEIAAYELLIRVARRASDEQTVEMAATNLGEERRMAQRLCGAVRRRRGRLAARRRARRARRSARQVPGRCARDRAAGRAAAAQGPRSRR